MTETPRDITSFPATLESRADTGGFKVLDAPGQALVYVYARKTSDQADIEGGFQ